MMLLTFNLHYWNGVVNMECLNVIKIKAKIRFRELFWKLLIILDVIKSVMYFSIYMIRPTVLLQENMHLTR